VAEEIMSICVDFLVELRGFEPMAIAVRGTRGGPDGGGAFHREQDLSVEGT
jgi:hypothetical protein